MPENTEKALAEIKKLEQLLSFSAGIDCDVSIMSGEELKCELFRRRRKERKYNSLFQYLPEKATKGILLLHLMPFEAIEYVEYIKRKVSGDAAIPEFGGNTQVNFDGVLTIDERKHGLTATQVFRDGAVEVMVAGLTSEGSQNSGGTVGYDYLCSKIKGGTKRMLESILYLEVNPPFAFGVTLLDLKECLLLPLAQSRKRFEFDRDEYLFPIRIITEEGLKNIEDFLEPTLSLAGQFAGVG